jgi:iron complex outermembrane receptor protein
MRIQQALLAVVLIGLTGTHFAMSAEQPAVADALEEITVTAEKREESAQKTPVSMNVYSATEIVQKGVVDIQTLSQTDTSLMFNRNGGEAALTVRGITTNNTTEIGNPAVPVGVDNFFVNRAAALDTTLFDVQRIEVLLGPQGTLYGRSATAGLVNITTAKPTKDLAAAASLEYGNYNALNVDGMLNIPVNDWLQLRGAITARRHDGYRVSTYELLGAQPDRGDDADSHAGRVTAAFEPSDVFHGWVSYQLSDEGGAGPVLHTVLFNYLSPGGDVSHARPDLGDPNAFPIYGTPWQRISDKVAKWNFEYDGLPAGITASYFGGYDTLSWRHSTSSISFFSFLSTTPNLFLPIRPFVQSEAPITQNHEIRLASAPTGFLTWQAGLYYFKEKNNLSSAGIVDPGSLTAQELLSFQYNVATDSKAGYAQGALHVTDDSALSLGARYSKDDVSRNGLFALPIFGIPPGPNGNGSYDSNKATWHVGYDWNVTPTNLAYAKVDTGYKPGGFSGCGTANYDYSPETVTTGEFGSKNRWAANTMEFNAAAFYSDYKNEQIQQFIANCATGSLTENAGKSQIYGLEADFKALVDPIGTFGLGMTYLHAVYKELALPPNYTPASGVYSAATCAPSNLQKVGAGVNCILNGNTMVNSPRFVVAASFDHAWETGPGTVDFEVDARYTASQYYDPFNFADTQQGAYTLFNSYLSYKQDTWKVGFYGRNLGNKAYINFGQEQTSGGATEYDYAYGAPRVFGIRFEVSTK